MKETGIGIFDNENEQELNNMNNNEINEDKEYYLNNNGDEQLYQTVKQNTHKIRTKYNLK